MAKAKSKAVKKAEAEAEAKAKAAEANQEQQEQQEQQEKPVDLVKTEEQIRAEVRAEVRAEMEAEHKAKAEEEAKAKAKDKAEFKRMYWVSPLFDERQRKIYGYQLHETEEGYFFIETKSYKNELKRRGNRFLTKKEYDAFLESLVEEEDEFED